MKQNTINSENNSLNEAPPGNSIEFAQQVVNKIYGLETLAVQLASERDQIFKLSTSENGRYILRFTNPAEDYLVTEFQTHALLHVANIAPELPLPRVIKTLNNRTDVKITQQDGRESYVRLITCLPGIALASIPHRNPAVRLEMATTLAKLGKALSDFRHPGSHHELLWDIKHAAKLRPYLSDIDDVEIRQLATQGLDNFERHALPLQTTLRSQVIHNDLNFSNLMIDEQCDNITGVIDFGDMVYAPLINDLAVATAYQLSNDDEDVLTILKNFVAAYHCQLPLQEQEIGTLYDLIVMRQVMTLVITARRAKHYPENKAYILRNQPTALKALKRLIVMNPVEIKEALLDACLNV